MANSDNNENKTDLGSLRPGKYSPGSKTVEAILQAALNVLIEEGSGAFTLSRIAAECNLQIGNVSRHFPRKEMLVQVLLYELLTASEELLKRRVYEAKMPPEEALALIITESLADISTKQTTRLFTEIWAMSNHNKAIAERMEATDRYAHALVGSFVKQLNPALSEDQAETVSLFINAAMNGATTLAGFGKPWEKKMPLLKSMAAKWLVDFAKTISSEEVGSVSW